MFVALHTNTHHNECVVNVSFTLISLG